MNRHHCFVCLTILTAVGLAVNSSPAAETNVISGRTGAVAVRVDERSARQAEPPAPAPKITMNDLLQRFAEARQKIKSFVIESRGVTTFNDQDLKWSGVNYTKTEYRYDGKRSKDTEFIWGNVARITPDVKENQANYRSSLWDGENEYYYQKADPPRPGSVTITYRDDPRRDRGTDGAAKFITHGAVGEIMGYHFSDDAVRIDELLGNGAAQLQLRGQTDVVRGVNCYVIDAVINEHGKYTIWIDPVHDYHIARIQVRRGPGNRAGKARVSENGYHNETVELSGFEKVGEVWFPKECALKVQVGSGNKQSSAYERHYRFTKVVFDPDHEALKSFVPNDIANGTPVRFRDLPPSQTFIWQNGAVVDANGSVVLDLRTQNTGSGRATPGGKK